MYTKIDAFKKVTHIFKMITTIEFTFSYILAVESFIATVLGLTGIILDRKRSAFTTTTTASKGM